VRKHNSHVLLQSTCCCRRVRGTYSSALGVSVCLECLSGKYLDTEDNDAEGDCILCGRGKYSGASCASSAAVSTNCPAGKQCRGAKAAGMSQRLRGTGATGQSSGLSPASQRRCRLLAACSLRTACICDDDTKRV